MQRLKSDNKLNKILIFFEDWIFLFKNLFRRTYEPLKSVRFILYFVVIVLGVGGIGFWMNLLRQSSEAQFFYSVSTFSLTLAAASFADIIINNQNEDYETFESSLSDTLVFVYTCFFILVSASAVLGLILCGFDLSQKIGYLSLDLGVICSKVSLILSLLFWWQVNSINPKLKKPETSPDEAVGKADQIDQNDVEGFNL